MRTTKPTTVKQLKEQLTLNKVSFNSKMNKEELITVYNNYLSSITPVKTVLLDLNAVILELTLNTNTIKDLNKRNTVLIKSIMVIVSNQYSDLKLQYPLFTKEQIVNSILARVTINDNKTFNKVLNVICDIKLNNIKLNVTNHSLNELELIVKSVLNGRIPKNATKDKIRLK